ncbi:hypothetical protein KACC15558_03310 [Brevibacterium ammoniilyticum]|uniref:Uncharacterized protein n=1 Tax=Brevibacterium ammoniilyticum TaxID=1046555 RepID=A0ABP9U2Z4_9MICO
MSAAVDYFETPQQDNRVSTGEYRLRLEVREDEDFAKDGMLAMTENGTELTPREFVAHYATRDDVDAAYGRVTDLLAEGEIVHLEERNGTGQFTEWIQLAPEEMHVEPGSTS